MNGLKCHFDDLVPSTQEDDILGILMSGISSEESPKSIGSPSGSYLKRCVKLVFKYLGRIILGFSFNMLFCFAFLLAIFLLGMATPMEVSKEGCPKSKGCFSFPESCTSSKDCDYLVTYVPDKDGVTISMSAKYEYAALGFNRDPAMSGGDSVVCFKSSNGASVGHYSLVGHYKPKRTVPVPAGVKPIASVYEDGVIKCSFKRLKVPTSPMKYNLNDNLYLLFAGGKVQDGDITKHHWSDRSFRSYNVSLTLKVEDKDKSGVKGTVTVDKAGCPKTKGCVAFPESCTSSRDCDYLVTYKPDADGVTFDMSAKSEYVALGFNSNPAMSGTDSVICYEGSIGHYSVHGHYKPTETRPTPKGIQLLAVVYSDGIIKCRFRRLKAPTERMKYDLHDRLYLIFARGKVKDNDIKEHDWKDRSYRMVNVSLTLEVEGRDYVLLITHACLMFMAWLGFGVIGMFTARYMRSSWGEKRVFNSSLWFQIHRGCMLMAVLLTIISAIIIFVHVGGWSESAGWHAVIGIFIIAISVSQPLLAFFRPEPHADSRFMFTWAHRFLALCGLCLAIINCFLGVSMLDELKSQGFAILAVFLVLFLLAVILYEVYLFKNKKPLLAPFTVNVDAQDNIGMEIPTTTTTTDDTAQTKEGSGDVDDNKPTPPPPAPAADATKTERGEVIRNVVYIFIIVLAFVCCVAFIIDIGSS